MNADRLVGKDFKFKSLKHIVDHWTKNFGPGGKHAIHRDHVVEFCFASRSLPQAIDRACASRTLAGKMHNHQSRVKEKDRLKFAALLKHEFAKNKPKDFDELHDRAEAAAIPGIGPVTIYDVATRVAAFLRLPVKSLYLHAGPRIGLYRLYDKRYPDIKRIKKQNLPKELQVLPADEVEDMLCAYREFIQPWYKGKEIVR